MHAIDVSGRTRPPPPHVKLDEIVIKAIAQSSGSHVVRRSS